MLGLECGAEKVGECVLCAIYDNIKTYVNLIRKCEANLVLLVDNLENLRADKDTIDDKVLEGKENLKKVTAKAELWLARVKELVNDESMKMLMHKDMRVAKVMLRLMKNDLKKLIEDDVEMRDVVVKVMKDIAKRKGKACNSREGSNVDEKEKEVGHVLEKLIEETIGEFKKLMQNDEKMAIAAMHLLENDKKKLEKLMEKDEEMADIIANARKTSDDAELLSDDENVVENVNTLKEKVKKLLKPVGNLIMHEELLETLPENVRLVMEAIDVVIGNRRGLKAELMDPDNTASQRNSCCRCVISCNYFSDRYHMSVAAEAMLVRIKDIIGTKPGTEDVTRSIRRGEMEGIPTNSVGLESRNELFQKIIKALASNDVHALGVFGMGGSGKTTLAKNIVNSKAEGTFETVVMVEISESPNIEFIQDQIGDGLGLQLHNVHGIREKAIRLYNKLKPEAEGGKKDNNVNAKKILIVLDNIWNKIDLEQMGIHRAHCKLLLTSRTKDVAKAMDVQEVNIFEVGLLNKHEAKNLFKFQVQKAVTGEYNSVADRLLEKCGGLPLAIVATANSLKGKELPFWRQFAEELEKPISCQISGVHHETFSIIRTSYEVMASEEKKKFFLLACLSPIGTSISIDNLMRYGIGLDLFQHVNKLSEAIDLARTWAEELVSSSMLLKGYSDKYVKIHDVVRESTMSFASKSGINTDGQMFLVDAIPRWICKETFDKYTGISLLSQANFARLRGVKANLLQILLLKGNRNQDSVLESNFFQGMTNLKVLEVLFMNFEKGLPESMGRLKVLQTLQLVECKLGDIKLIGELGSLLVLSLRGSSLEGLPDEIGKLYELRLLDMSKCRCKEPRIPANVIAGLSLLEGLYLVGSSFTEWAVMESTSNDTGVSTLADIEDLTKLDFLNVLELHIRELVLPISDQFVKNLDKFRISVGQEYFRLLPSSRSLSLATKFDVSQELKKDNCLKALLKKTDRLALKSATVKNIVPELDKEGFRDLSRLELSNIDSMSRICEGKAPTELFYNLFHLRVSQLENLEVLLPVNPLPRKMTTLRIRDCNSLTYILSEDNVLNKESDIIELPCLKTLELDGVSNLISFVKESNNDDRQRPGFFNNKVALTSLEELSLKSNKSIVKIWDKESNLNSFQNLKDLRIRDCGEMESIGLPSIFLSLVKLETLSINNCKKMQQVISDGSETQGIPKEIITFPNLKRLQIKFMENLKSFYDGSCKMAFPSLERLELNCKRMTKFAGGTSSTAFFPKTIEFPSLESLWLYELSDEVRVLWDLPVGEGQGISSNPLPNLKTLVIRKIKLPSIVFPSLSDLTVEAVGDAKFLFSSSSENEGCVGTFSQFPKLEKLWIQGCAGSVKQQFIEDDGSTAILNFCGQLRSLWLQSALNMEVVSLHLFKSLRDVYISDLACEYLFSADGGFLQLQSLEVLRIYNCPNLEVIIRGGDKDTTVVFPRLKTLALQDLEGMTKFCSISDIPSLERLGIYSCNKLESLFFGEPNQVVELPSLEKVTIRS
ncbi:disease resistance protein At4g27190 isoform X3 [Silene latifolia]